MSREKILMVLFGLTGLFALRYFEVDLFYDPLLTYFKGDYKTEALPDFTLGFWLFNVTLRYALNVLFQLLILAGLFGQRSIINFSWQLYLVILVLLIPVLLVLTLNHEPGQYRALFYVRRFLIHPFLVLLLIPSFFLFQQNKKQ